MKFAITEISRKWGCPSFFFFFYFWKPTKWDSWQICISVTSEYPQNDSWVHCCYVCCLHDGWFYDGWNANFINMACVKLFCHLSVLPILQHVKDLTAIVVRTHRLMFYHCISHPLCKSKTPYYHVNEELKNCMVRCNLHIIVGCKIVTTRWGV